MALAWLLAHEGVTSVIVGASSVSQLDSNLDAASNLTFTEAEMNEINQILG